MRLDHFVISQSSPSTRTGASSTPRASILDRIIYINRASASFFFYSTSTSHSQPPSLSMVNESPPVVFNNSRSPHILHVFCSAATPPTSLSFSIHLYYITVYCDSLVIRIYNTCTQVRFPRRARDVSHPSP